MKSASKLVRIPLAGFLREEAQLPGEGILAPLRIFTRSSNRRPEEGMKRGIADAQLHRF
ncbi:MULTISPECIES: hypothetical protein [Bradyrhizobium]|uniref:hypothetical protein n=1 Tax=Bradyrhizobium TaxID=374 RepID=UPI001CD5DAC0|nr:MULTISPECIES: hypothetical protein [Bradyrhizobium]